MKNKIGDATSAFSTSFLGAFRQVANTMQTWPGPLAMIGIFRKLYGSYASPSMVKQNNFSNFQQYFLQQAIPKAMAGLRTVHRICPPEVAEMEK